MKKGQVFLTGFVGLTIVFLTVLAVAVHLDEPKDIQERVGFKSAVILNQYNEGERMLYYLQKSSEYANEEAWRALLENGGSIKGSCSSVKGISGKEYVIWNDCPIDLKKNYITTLNEKLSNYVESYESIYANVVDREKQRSEIYFLYNPYYTNLFKTVKLNNMTLNDKYFVLNFSNLTLISENNISVYQLKPRIKVKAQDSTIFTKVYNILLICKENDSPFSKCKTDLTTSFPGTEIERENDILRISVPTNISLGLPIINFDKSVQSNQVTRLYLALNTSKELQSNLLII